MSRSLILLAMPTRSRFFQLIANSPQASAIYGHLLMHGFPWTPWRHRNKWPDEIDGVIDELSTWEMMGSRVQVGAVLDELLTLYELAVAENAGLDERGVFLNTQAEIERALAVEFRTQQLPNPGDMASVVVFGSEYLAPAGRAPAPGMGLRLNRPNVVAEAFQRLDGISAERLLGLSEEFAFEDFQALVQLYSAAAERREAVLVGSGFMNPHEN